MSERLLILFFIVLRAYRERDSNGVVTLPSFIFKKSNASWTTGRITIGHLLRMVLIAASHLLDFHLRCLRIALRVLLLECSQLGLHASIILTSVVVHLLLQLLILLILILRTLHHWRQIILISHCVGG